MELPLWNGIHVIMKQRFVLILVLWIGFTIGMIRYCEVRYVIYIGCIKNKILVTGVAGNLFFVK